MWPLPDIVGRTVGQSAYVGYSSEQVSQVEFSHVSCLRQWLEFHLIAQTCESSDELFLFRLAITFFKGGFTDFSIAGPLTQEMRDHHQHAMSERHGSPLGPSSAGNATRLSGQVGVLDSEPPHRLYWLVLATEQICSKFRK